MLIKDSLRGSEFIRPIQLAKNWHYKKEVHVCVGLIHKAFIKRKFIIKMNWCVDAVVAAYIFPLKRFSLKTFSSYFSILLFILRTIMKRNFHNMIREEWFSQGGNENRMRWFFLFLCQFVSPGHIGNERLILSCYFL